MTLRGWDPLKDLLLLQERMNRLFEESFARGRSDEPMPSGGWAPPADVYETGDAFIVLMDLAGLSHDDVEVRVDGDGLTVRGERLLRTSARPESFQRLERSYGQFSRSFRFPDEVDPDRVSAQFRDGLLRLDLPKAGGPKGR